MKDDNPLPYTRSGRLLLLVSIVIAMGGTFGTIYMLAESLSNGRYPLFLFALPYAVFALLFFFAGCNVLRRIGIAVRKDDVRLIDGSVRKATSIARPED